MQGSICVFFFPLWGGGGRHGGEVFAILIYFPSRSDLDCISGVALSEFVRWFNVSRYEDTSLFCMAFWSTDNTVRSGICCCTPCPWSRPTCRTLLCHLWYSGSCKVRFWCVQFKMLFQEATLEGSMHSKTCRWAAYRIPVSRYDCLKCSPITS